MSRKTVQQKLKRFLMIRQAFHLVWQSAAQWTLASLILMLIQGFLPVLSLYLLKLLLDRVNEQIIGDAPLDFGHLVWPIVLAGIVALIGVLLGAAAGLVNEAQTQAVTDHVHELVHSHSIKLDLEFYENAEYYDTLHRAGNEAAYRPARIVNGLFQLGQCSVSLVAILLLLFSLYPAVAFILPLAAVPAVLIRLRYAGLSFRWLRKHTAEERQSWYFDWMLSDVDHAKEIRMFELGPLFIQRFRHIRAKLRSEKLKLAVHRALIELVTYGSLVLAVSVSLALMANCTINGQITLSELVIYYQAFQRGQTLLQEWMRSAAGLYEDGLFLSYLDEFLALQPRITNPPEPLPVPKLMQAGIVFENVSFQYPTSRYPVLNRVNLSLHPAEIIALVGANGEGKTTLIKLLCRLYDPTEGRILLDGVDIRQFQVESLRRAISIVFQDYVHYNLSAEENIWAGDVSLPLDRERIVKAAEKSGANGAIEQLTHGYDTILGKLFQDGEELSVGQWQKIALARAFLRESQIIVLDEPTSALDAIAEHEVFQRFRQMIGQKSAVLISHRLSTVRLADRIYVLEGGRIIESGTHDALVQLNGKYATLYNLQAQNYH